MTSGNSRSVLGLSSSHDLRRIHPYFIDFCSARTSMGLAKSTNTGGCEPSTFRYDTEFRHNSSRRTPSWTDRVLYATYSDDPGAPEKSNITNLLYTSVPGYTTSDHVGSFYTVTCPPRLTAALLYRNLSSHFFSFRLPPLYQSLPKGAKPTFQFSSSLQTSSRSSYRTPP